MKIWMLGSDSQAYDRVIAVPYMSIKDTGPFDGRTKSDRWRPVKLKRAKPEAKLPLGDAPKLNLKTPVFSQRAVDILQPYWGGAAEALPVRFDEGSFYIINTTKLIDGLDREKTQFKGLRIRKYVFRAEAVSGHDLFKLVDEPGGVTYVSDAFVQAVETADLKGFKFYQIWDSEAEEVTPETVQKPLSESQEQTKQEAIIRTKELIDEFLAGLKWETEAVWVEPEEIEIPMLVSRIPEDTVFDQHERRVFERLKTEYEQNETYDKELAKLLRQRAEDERDTSGIYYHVLPYDYERGGFKQGRLLEAGQGNGYIKDGFNYYFDEEGRTIYRHSPERMSLDLCVYHNDEGMVYQYREDKLKACRLYLPQQHICYSYGAGGRSKEEYIYNAANHLERIIHYGQGKGNFDIVRYEYVFEIERGELQWIILCYNNGLSKIVYNRAGE